MLIVFVSLLSGRLFRVYRPLRTRYVKLHDPKCAPFMKNDTWQMRLNLAVLKSEMSFAVRNQSFLTYKTFCSVPDLTFAIPSGESLSEITKHHVTIRNER